MTNLAALPRQRHTLTAALTAVLLASVLAGLANSLVALLAHAAGVSDSFRPLQPATFLTLTILGVIAGVVGWFIMGRTARARTVLHRWVPLVVVASWIPDVMLGVTQAQPHTSWTAVGALMVMHVVVAAIALPTFARFIPLRSVSSPTA